VELLVTIPIVTPSQNKWQNWHWSKRHSWQQECLYLWRSALNKARIGRKQLPNAFQPEAKPDKRKRLEAQTGVSVALEIRSFRHNTLDHGNLVGGCKGLVDCLVQEGVLLDDSPDWLSDSYEQTIDRKDKRTEIVLR
jgi:hypothetical protein